MTSSPEKKSMERSAPSPTAALKQASTAAPPKSTGASKAPRRGRGKKNWSKNKRLTSSGPGVQVSTPSATRVKFSGACKKELEGDVIEWSPSTSRMTKDFGEFNDAVVIVAGTISSQMGISIDNQEKLLLRDFLPAAADESEWLDEDE